MTNTYVIGIREENRVFLESLVEANGYISKLQEIRSFICSLSDLLFSRDFILQNNKIISPINIIVSAELTVGNVISCCEHGCFSDANILVRKTRDDLFFYLYLMLYKSYCDEFPENNRVEKNRKIVDLWINDSLSGFDASDVFKEIGSSLKIKEAVEKYGLKKLFEIIGKRLNNYVHGNGMSFYNGNIRFQDKKAVCKQLNSISEDLCFFTLVFVFLLALCDPSKVMSSDYVDFLDFGMTPPENSQYWVAPFIASFITKNANLLDDNALQYFQESTFMVL